MCWIVASLKEYSTPTTSGLYFPLVGADSISERLYAFPHHDHRIKNMAADWESR
jgi:hypothetical protein